MLRVNILETTENQLNPSENVVITFTAISQVIQTYAKLNHDSWLKSNFPRFIATRMAGLECDSIRALHAIVSPQVFDEHTLLNSTQLFELAIILAKVVNSRDKILHEAIQPLINSFGKNRLKIANTLKNRNRERSVLLFDVICKIPDENARYVGPLLWLENDSFQLTADNLELIKNHSDRLKPLFEHTRMIYHSLKALNSNTPELNHILDISNLMGFLMLYIQQEQSNNAAWINIFLNQVVAAAINHQDHLLDITYALAWVTNHGINNQANIQLINQQPEDLACLQQIGLTAVEDKKINRDYNQKLFDFAIEESVRQKNYSGKLFNVNDIVPESKESAENPLIKAPSI